MTTYRIADDVAWVSSAVLDLADAPTAYVAALPHGPANVLEGTACALWLALAECGPDGATAEVVTDVALRMAGIEASERTRVKAVADAREALRSLVMAGVATEIATV